VLPYRHQIFTIFSNHDDLAHAKKYKKIAQHGICHNRIDFLLQTWTLGIFFELNIKKG
jgi:hypothetical protein